MKYGSSFSHRLYGQLAFSLAAGLLQEKLLNELQQSNGYYNSVQGIAQKMDRSVTRKDVEIYLRGLEFPKPMEEFREIRIDGKNSAIACADFFLRSHKETHEQLLVNKIGIMERGRLLEDGQFRTITQGEVHCFVDQVFRRTAYLQS